MNAPLSTITVPLSRQHAAALALFIGQGHYYHPAMDNAVLRIDDTGAQWEATNGKAAIIIRPGEQPKLDPGVYILSAAALLRCARMPAKIRSPEDDVVTVAREADDAKDRWPDLVGVLPDINARVVGPFVAIAGPLLDLLPKTQRALTGRLHRNHGWRIHIGGPLEASVYLPELSKDHKDKVMVLLMPLRTDGGAPFRTKAGWLVTP